MRTADALDPDRPALTRSGRAFDRQRYAYLSLCLAVLGRAGINIVDMALYPAPDMRDGVIALWVGGDDAGQRAEELISGLGHPVARP